jgi:hypothetical protein
MVQEPRNCAPRSSSTAHCGIVSKSSPVKPDHRLQANAPVTAYQQGMPDWCQDPRRHVLRLRARFRY